MGLLLASEPNEILAMDYTMLEPTRNGFENVLLTDVFSKYTLAVPTRDQRASTVAQVLVTEWFSKLGVPERIHSDPGQNFESALIQQLCGLYGIEKSQTTPYHPARNVSESDLIAYLTTCCTPCQHSKSMTGTLAYHRYCMLTTLPPIN